MESNFLLRGAKREPEISAKDVLSIKLAPNVSMEFVRIPAGEFLMGSDKQKDKQAEDRETPQHKVRLKNIGSVIFGDEQAV